MADQYLRDRTGKIVGYETADGWMRDRNGTLVAKVGTDGRTRNREGFIVGDGDQRLRELQKRNGG